MISRGPCFDDVKVAAERIAAHAHETPVMTSRTLDARLGAKLFLKCENFQRVGAFKFRGAYNAVAALDAKQRERGVVAYSSGNHAQALALAARLHQSPATIIMPEDAPRAKIAATKGYGARVRFYDRYSEDRQAIGAQLAQDEGLALIPPYDHPDVIAGQGTAALELLQATGSLDYLFVPLGGGGLLAGTALSAAALWPNCRVIGVEPEAGDDGRRSFLSGQIVKIAPPRSIADGAVVTHLGGWNFPIIRTLVSDVVTTPDAALVETMRFLVERLKLWVEPTGCLGLAAALAMGRAAKGARIGVILSGGNMDPGVFSALMGQARQEEEEGLALHQ